MCEALIAANMDSLIQEFLQLINLCDALTVVNMDSLIQDFFTVDKSVWGSDSC